jgi:hypothetical protein
MPARDVLSGATRRGPRIFRLYRLPLRPAPSRLILLAVSIGPGGLIGPRPKRPALTRQHLMAKSCCQRQRLADRVGRALQGIAVVP